jgi:hypothetical protein
MPLTQNLGPNIHNLSFPEFNRNVQIENFFLREDVPFHFPSYTGNIFDGSISCAGWPARFL